MKRRAKKILRSPLFWIIIIILLIARTITPAMVLRQTNRFLQNFSKTYSGHIEDIDFDLFRGAYNFEGFSLHLKKYPNDRFLFIKKLDVSIAWREIFAGKINTDISVEEMKLIITTNFVNKFSQKPDEAKKESGQLADRLFPVRVGRLDIKNSSFEFAELLDIPEAQRWRLTNISGRLSNATPTLETPLSLLSLRGALFNSAMVKIVSQINTLSSPTAWDMDLELKDFNLANANSWLKRKVPLTFTAGKLDLYSELRSEEGQVLGYVKPFFHKAAVIANNELFINLKHFVIEVSAATLNLVLQKAKGNTLATKVLFSYEDHQLKINSAKALAEAFKNGFSEKIPEGLDDEISLSKKYLSISKNERL